MFTVACVKRERLSEMIAFRVYPSLYQVVIALATKERRKLSEVELALFERGVAAYQRDGLLFEPEEKVRSIPFVPSNQTEHGKQLHQDRAHPPAKVRTGRKR